MMPGKINSLLHVHWRMPKRISSIPNKIRNSIISDLYLKILLLLTVTGFILRLYHLGDVSIWLDEGFTHLYSSTSFFDIWHICFSFEQNPPLYYWIEHVILQFGDSEVILRIFSVIIGTLTIPLIFYAGKEFYNEDIGIISAALLTFSTFHILYSQEARSYSLLVFFLTIALIWYLKSVQTNDVKTWFIFGIFSALAIWTHYFAIIPIGTLFLYVLIYQMKTSGKISSFKPILLSGLVVLILSSPLFIMMLNSLISKVESAMTMNWGIQGFSLIISIFSDNLGPGKAKALLLGTFVIIGLISLFWMKREKFLFLIFMILVPLPVLYYASFWIPVVSRYSIFLLPFLLISISFFFLLFQKYVKKPLFIITVVIIIGVICIPSLSAYYSADSKNGEDWKDASLNIKNLAEPGSVIVIMPGYCSIPFNYYYNNTSGKTYEFSAENQSDIDNIISANKEKKVFLIVRNMNMLNKFQLLNITWVNGHFILEYKKNSISIYNTG